MSRIHDMGGRHGTGEIPDKNNTTVFHAPWHARALATTLAAGALGAWNIDASRHARERLKPRDYECFSYYEKWMAALANLLVERGVLTRNDLRRAADANSSPPDTPAPLAETALPGHNVGAAMHTVTPYSRPTGPKARFNPGDRVRTARYNPNRRASGGHTRLPSYAMGRIGTVKILHGNYVLPDSNAHFQGESPEPLYAVEFTAAALWHHEAGNPADTVILDLWQSYLEAAE